MALIKKYLLLVIFVGLTNFCFAQDNTYESALTGEFKRVDKEIEWKKTVDADIYEATLILDDGSEKKVLVDLSVSEDLRETKSVVVLGRFNDEHQLVASRVISDTSGPSDELIFVVVGVILVLFGGFFLYMINSGRKLRSLERELEDKK